MRGRKPKPTSLKVITGNPGKRPLNPREPKPALRVPTCPAHLSPTAKAEWKRLAQQLHVLGILSVLDRATMAAYCRTYGRWVEAERKLRETPLLVTLPYCPRGGSLGLTSLRRAYEAPTNPAEALRL